MLIRFLKEFVLEKVAVVYVDHSQWKELHESLCNEIDEDDIFPEVDLVYSKVFHNRSKENLETFLKHVQRRAKGKPFPRF